MFKNLLFTKKGIVIFLWSTFLNDKKIILSIVFFLLILEKTNSIFSLNLIQIQINEFIIENSSFPTNCMRSVFTYEFMFF